MVEESQIGTEQSPIKWNEVRSTKGFDIGVGYWCIAPGSNIRWHVTYQRARTLGSTSGQILNEDGWYWYTADWDNHRFSSMFGPFSSAEAAKADCEVAHR